MTEFIPSSGRLNILRKYGIYRAKSSKELRSYQKDLREKLYRKQNGICALSGVSFPIGEMTLEHKIPYQLLRVLGFDPKERWSEENLCLAHVIANNEKRASITDPDFQKLFANYWECVLELNSFENDKQGRLMKPQVYNAVNDYY